MIWYLLLSLGVLIAAAGYGSVWLAVRRKRREKIEPRPLYLSLQTAEPSEEGCVGYPRQAVTFTAGSNDGTIMWRLP